MTTAPIPATAYSRPWTFFALSMVIPWGAWLTAGWISHSAYATELHWLVLALAIGGLCAPFVLTLVMVARYPTLRADLGARFTNVDRITPWAAVLAVALLPVFLLLGTGISLLFGYSPEQFELRNVFIAAAGGVPVWATLLLAPLVEELAWHGYGTDALVSRWTVWRTTMVFAIWWMLWHMPLATIAGSYQAEVVETGWLSSANFLVSVFPFMILMNWLYYRCGRNIWVPVLFHLSANIGNEVFATHPDTKAFQTMLLIVLCAWVLWHDRDLFFTKLERLR